MIKTRPIIFWKSMTSAEFIRSVGKSITNPHPKSEMWNLISPLSSFEAVDNASSEEIQSKSADEDENENPKLRPATRWTERFVTKFERTSKNVFPCRRNGLITCTPQGFDRAVHS